MKTELEIELELQYLRLPSRYEILEKEVNDKSLSIIQIVHQVPKALRQIKLLIRQLEVNNLGRFQIFYGNSGVGKTTFLKTLSFFNNKIKVIPIPFDLDLLDVFEFVIEEIEVDKFNIFMFDDRDNPNESIEDLKDFFEQMRKFFRTDKGKIIIIWPITDNEASEYISKLAWNTARDSIMPDNEPFFFEGLSKEEFYDIADNTSKNINGIGLELYGIKKSEAEDLVKKCDTIGQYFSKIENLSNEIFIDVDDFLEDKIIPKVWILVPGDDAQETDRIVKYLTKGVKYELDIERFLAILDDPKNDSNYLKEWREKREIAGFLMRLLDVRIIPIFPNLTVPCIRAYGDEKIRKVLRNSKGTKATAIDKFKDSIVFKLLKDDISSNTSNSTRRNNELSEEYIRIQKFAESQDKLLNKALGNAIIDTFDKEKISIPVYIESQNLKGFNLKPDIQIVIDNKNIICLEPTWRSTGVEIEGEIPKKQSTLTLGHIQQYVLAKVMEYVKELDIKI